MSTITFTRRLRLVTDNKCFNSVLVDVIFLVKIVARVNVFLVLVFMIALTV